MDASHPQLVIMNIKLGTSMHWSKLVHLTSLRESSKTKNTMEDNIESSGILNTRNTAEKKQMILKTEAKDDNKLMTWRDTQNKCNPSSNWFWGR